MHPIPESVEAAQELARTNPEFNLLGGLRQMSEQIEKVVPECVGLSVAWLVLGVSFTLVATDTETAGLDAAQYLDGGPCIEGAHEDEVVTARVGDPLDEGRWELFSQAAAAHGVASSLTIPLVDETESGSRAVGSVNMYASTPDAFDGHHEALAAIVGGNAGAIVRNADLSFSTRAVSEQAPAVLEGQWLTHMAAGIHSARMEIPIDAALAAIADAARRAGIDTEDVARIVIKSHKPGSTGDAQ